MFLADLHWNGRGTLPLPDLSGYDLVVLGGDLTHFGGKTAAQHVVQSVRSQVPYVFAVCGNCDQPACEEALRELDCELDGRSRQFGGVTWWGLSGGLPYDGCPYEREESEYRRLCESLCQGPGPHVLISHQPPYGTRVDVTGGRPVGSRAIRELIEQRSPVLALSGHIHEAYGTDTLGNTTLANPGPWASRRCLSFRIKDGRVEALELHLRSANG